MEPASPWHNEPGQKLRLTKLTRNVQTPFPILFRDMVWMRRAAIARSQPAATSAASGDTVSALPAHKHDAGRALNALAGPGGGGY